MGEAEMMRRSEMEMQMDMLKALSHGQSLFTTLMTKTNVNSTKAKRILQNLEKRGLVKEEPLVLREDNYLVHRKNLYSITYEGFAFMKNYLVLEGRLLG